tara:strand:- start:1076 stop:1318 length:243 start_codon:yes stop_codon:yes gene_type:complete
MNKAIMLVGLLSGLSCQPDGTKVELLKQSQWDHLINNVQDMREWMEEDLKQGIIDSTYAEYYLKYLNETEDISIKLYNTK